MIRQIDKYLNNESYIDILAEEIVEFFDTYSNSDNNYCDFTLSKGKMENLNDNTWFFCDINESNEELYNLKKALFNEDLQKMTRKEEKIFDKAIEEFMKKISEKIIKDYEDRIRRIIRRNCFPNSKDEIISMEEIIIRQLNIVDIDFIYSPPGPYILTNPKLVIKENFKNDDKSVDKRLKNIMSFINNEVKRTGRDPIKIFDEEKLKNDKLKHYSFWVIDPNATLRKMDWDLTISFYINYSPRKETIEKSTIHS